MKLEDLLEYLAELKEDGKIKDCCVANIFDAIVEMEDVDYLPFGNDRFFIYER